MSKIIEVQLDLKGKWYDRQPVKVNKEVFEIYMKEYIVRIPLQSLQRFYFGTWTSRELYEHAYNLYKREELEKNIIELNPELEIDKLPLCTWSSFDLAIFEVFGDIVKPIIENNCQKLFEVGLKTNIKLQRLNEKKVRFIQKDGETYIVPDKLFKNMTFIDYENINEFSKENKVEII